MNNRHGTHQPMKVSFRSHLLLAIATWGWAFNAGADAGIAAPARALTEPRQVDSPRQSGASAVPIADLFYARGSYDASIAPDGRDLVISTNLTGRHNLWLMPVAGGFPLQLTRSDERQWRTVFSPDGKSIVFASDHAGAEMFDLYSSKAHDSLRILATWIPPGSESPEPLTVAS